MRTFFCSPIIAVLYISPYAPPVRLPNWGVEPSPRCNSATLEGPKPGGSGTDRREESSEEYGRMRHSDLPSGGIPWPQIERLKNGI